MKNKQYEVNEAVILCGGMGTRLRSIINQCPKPLAPVGKKVFLDLLVESLMKQEIKKIIFSVGYMKEKIIERYSELKEVEVCFSKEETPLGTGGAIRNAIKYVSENQFIVLNGDSYIDISYREIIKKIKKEKGDSLIVVNKNFDNRKDVGVLIIENGRITQTGHLPRQNQKNSSYVNCGIYILNKVFFQEEMQTSFSLENYAFPKIINSTNVIPFVTDSKLYDIGTPERYARFLEING